MAEIVPGSTGGPHEERQDDDTTFFPVGEGFIAARTSYVDLLKGELLFGPDDPLFFRQKRIRGERGFTADGLSREFYERANPLNFAVQNAFENAQLPRFTPHSFRHMLAEFDSELELSPKQFKAWPMYLGHDHVMTTVYSYLQITESDKRDHIMELNALI